MFTDAEIAAPSIPHYLERLIPNEADRSYVFDHLAHLLQKPDVKIAHAPLIVDAYFHNGRCPLVDIAIQLFGKRHVVERHPGQLTSTCKQLLVVTDWDAKRGFFEVDSDLLNALAGDTSRTPRGVIMVMKEDKSLNVFGDEGRFRVIQSGIPGRGCSGVSEYHWPLRRAVEAGEGVEAFRDWLMGRDLSLFDAGEPKAFRSRRRWTQTEAATA